MPSLVLTGHPCIGKTSLAHLLAARALRHPSNDIARVIRICESTACPDRTKAECYSNSHMEKTTRAALKSEFDRAVMSKSREDGGQGDRSDKGGSTLVILDSLNYIKGYRYELYCISKAAGERHGVVWVMGDNSDGDCLRTDGSKPSDELAKKRNKERKGWQTVHCDNEASLNEIDLDGYFEDDETMDGLVLRYEPPDEKNRWENPLYKVNVTSVLPWGKDGTVLEATSDPNDPTSTGVKNNEHQSKSLRSEMKALEVKDLKDSPSQPSSALANRARKSASGFKRRGKKSTQKGATNLPKSATTPSSPTDLKKNVPSSMASRNLTLGASEDQSGGSIQKMEDVIDRILDSFLTNVAPLREGMSTFKNISAESNVLNQMDNLTQRINNEILKAQKMTSLSAGMGGKTFITLSNGGDGGEIRRRALNLSKPLYGNQLRSFRRQFLKWIAGHPMPEGTKEEEMVEGYIAYLESHI